MTGFFFCLVVGLMVFFVIRFRRRTPNDATSQVTHNTPLEIVWTASRWLLVIAFFYLGFKGFVNYDTPRSDCAVWTWGPRNGRLPSHIPTGHPRGISIVVKDQPVRLNMHSIDVLHGLYLPNLGTQRNLVPRQTYLWFIPTVYTRTRQKVRRIRPRARRNWCGSEGYPIYCTQYCGNGHSRMTARLYVLTRRNSSEDGELANPFDKEEGRREEHWVPYWEVGEVVRRTGLQVVPFGGRTDSNPARGRRGRVCGSGPHEFAYIQPGSGSKRRDTIRWGRRIRTQNGKTISASP